MDTPILAYYNGLSSCSDKSKDLSMISFPQPIVKFGGIYQSWLGATVLNVIKNIFLAKNIVTNIPLYRIQSRI